MTRIAIQRLAALFLTALLAACSAMPEADGPKARLLPGIAKPRALDEVNITIHEVPITAWGKCLEVVSRASPMMAVMSVLTLSPIHGCALVARDKDLKPGQKPWCVIAFPSGDWTTLGHELRHCQGWDHPAGPQNAKTDGSS